MRKKISSIIAIGASVIMYAQVGINIETPKATLDIEAKQGTGNASHAEGILIPRVDRLRAQSMSNVSTSTLIYINDITTGSQMGLAQNIDSNGFYYFDGLAWVKVDKDTHVNLYNTDGALTDDRTVTMADRKLMFTGTINNAFSVDGNTFSVDAQNNRVGIGTITPPSVLSVVNPTAGNLIDALSVGINNCGGACAQETARNLVLFNANSSNGNFAAVDFVPGTQATGLSGASIRGIDRNVANGYAGLSFFTRNATDYASRLTIKSGGNVGIGTQLPSHRLHIAGADNPLRLEGLQTGDINNDRIMVVDASGVAKAVGSLSTLSVPTPAVFVLETDQTSFLSTAAGGGSQLVPMIMKKNAISGLTYNATSNRITLPAGTYQFTFIYEGIHEGGCTLSSYFIDFPFESGLTRVHSNAAHGVDYGSVHGGTIMYTATVPADKPMDIHLGRGVGGNCSGAGMTLKKNSTQLLIYRIGD